MPGTLIGRDEHCQQLLQAYECSIHKQLLSNVDENRKKQHLVLIQGHSGTGKTALARSLQERVKHDSGYFLTGKFELLGVKDPYAVFVSAFNQYTDKLLGGHESSPNVDVRLSSVRSVVHDAVGSEGKLLTNIIPALERLIDHQEESCDVHGADALNRFQFVFCKFCRAVSTITPLVLFFDDLQWSDTASLELLYSLLQSGSTLENESSLLVIGAYRDEGVHDDSDYPEGDRFVSPLQVHLRTLEELCTAGALRSTKINLQNLNESGLNNLVAGFLQTPVTAMEMLGQIIYSKSQGNPFHAIQLLRLFVSKGHLYQIDERWIWDEQDILQAISSADTIDELVRHKLASLPLLSQQVLKAAACMGDAIDMSALVAIFDETRMPSLELSLQAASRDGHLVFNRRLGLYHFAHDRIRQIMLSMIDDKDELSFEIGYKLWKRSSHHFLDTNLFLVANLLNHGTYKLKDQAERYMAAGLDLEAGVKAISLAAFQDASRYLKAGITFLEGGDYWNEKYSLALDLFTAAAEAELCNQCFDQVSELTAIVIQHAHGVKESMSARLAQMIATGQQGNIAEAFNHGLDVLRQLDEPLPERASMLAIISDDFKTKIALRWRTDEALLALSPMDNEEKIAAMHILTCLAPYMFRAASMYTPLIGTKLVRLCLRFGLHKSCAFGFINYGWIQCGTDRNFGYRMGRLALSIIEKYRAKEMVPRVHAPFYGFIHHWKCPLRQSLEFLENAARIGMEIGDVEYAMISLQFRCMNSFCCGVSLSLIDGMFTNAIRQFEIYKQDSPFKASLPFLQCIHNLMGRAPTPKLLSGDVVGRFDPTESIDDKTIPYAHYVLGLDLALLFGDVYLAKDNLERKRNLNFHPHAAAIFAFDCFKEALLCVALARLGENKRMNIKIAKKMRRRLRGWAKDCASNFLHKQRLVEAEISSLTPHRCIRRRIEVLYTEAINGAIKEQYVQEAALSCELAGDYMSRQGYMELAKAFWRRARDLYGEWGATEKASTLLMRIRT